jgi:hypothetical protein
MKQLIEERVIETGLEKIPLFFENMTSRYFFKVSLYSLDLNMLKLMKIAF